MKHLKLFTASLLFATAANVPVQAAGAYIFAGESNGIDVIAHPIGYNGSVDHTFITVGIDPTSVDAANMVAPTKNVIDVFNRLAANNGNLAGGVSSGFFDFESVLLHEMGHSIGMAHTNAASESGLSGADTNYTKATDGANNTFNINDGPDNIIGSSDDIRGDDVNLLWYRTGVNNPSIVPPATVDKTTYSRDLAGLPGGHTFASNPDRTVLAALGAGSTEAVMQQGTFSAEAQRTLAHSDVITLLLARSGVDGIQGTADDYGVTLIYAGLTAAAEITIDFDNSETGFAVSGSSGLFLDSDNIRITSNNIYFNDGFNWEFNSTENDTTGPTVAAINLVDATPTMADVVNFEVVFSEKVVWVPTDALVATTLPSGATITDFSTSDAITYNVEVTATDANEGGDIRLSVTTPGVIDGVGNNLSAAFGPSAPYVILAPAAVGETWTEYE